MAADRTEFDEKRFQGLLVNQNYLGAWMLIKETRLEKTEEAILVGRLCNHMVVSLNQARRDDEREKQAFNRSLLAYILKDWPGLASLYREQLRPSLPGFVPDNLQDLWQEFSDVMSGRKGLDESFRQRMDETRSKAREFGVDLDPWQEMAKHAEKEFRKGAEAIGELLKSVLQGKDPGASTPGGAQAGQAGQAGGPGRPNAPGPESTEAPEIKVKIQNANDPLPKDIHQADPADSNK